MSYENLLFERAGEVTTIILNRPEVHNALDRKLSAELSDAVRAVRADRQCRVLVIRGAGNTFCAGDDIKESTSGRSRRATGKCVSTRRPFRSSKT